MNLKSAICAMVERLDDGVKRLELASDASLSVETAFFLGVSDDRLTMARWYRLDI